jgi:FixJ family two-component response regulator
MNKLTTAGDVRIVIIDDDAAVREATGSLFRSMGFTALAFSSAEEFLRSGDAERTSCLVVDVQMPGMGGLKLQSHLAAAGRRIPIVFITAYSDEAVRATALNAGAVCFLSKPFNERDLLKGLRSALRGARNTL